MSLLESLEELEERQGSVKTGRNCTTVIVKDRATFLDMLKSASDVTATTDMVPALKHVKMDIKKKIPTTSGPKDGNALFLIGGDGDRSLMRGAATLAGAENALIEADREVSVLVPGKLFYGICNKLPGNEFKLEIEEEKLVISCGKNASYDLQVLDVSEYTVLSPENGVTVEVDSQTFSSVLANMLYACADAKENTTVLQGVHIVSGQDGVRFEASNRSQIAMEYLQPTKDIPEDTKLDIVISQDNMKTLCSTFKNVSGSLKLISGRNTVAVTGGGMTFICRVLEGTFPNLSAAIPTTHKVECIVNQQELEKALDRIMLLIDKGRKGAEFIVDSTQLSINARGEYGKGGESLFISECNGEMKFHASADIVLSSVKSMHPYKKFRLTFSEPLKPLVLTPLNEDGSAASRKAVFVPLRQLNT